MDAFVGEIRLMSFPFPPKGWAYCQGQSLPINQNQALFSLLGIMYGGDGVTTFKLPDLRGRLITGAGTAPGGSSYTQGQIGGVEQVGLTVQQMPGHGHAFQGTIQVAAQAEAPEPNGGLPASGPSPEFAAGTPNASLGASTVSGTTSNSGGGQAHDNRQPLIALNYAIALTGYFPSRP